MEAVAVLTRNGVRRKRRRKAVSRRHGLHNRLIRNNIVCGLNGRAVLKIDDVLPRAAAVVRAFRCDTHILERQADLAAHVLALILRRGIHKARVVKGDSRCIAVFIVLEKVEFVSCPKFKYYTMKFCNVNRFFQDAAAVDVKTGAIRTTNVAEKAHDAPVCGPPRQKRHGGGIRHQKELAVRLFFKAHDARSINGNAALERRSQKARLNGDDLLSAENIAERHFDELNVVICDKLCDLGLRILHAEPFLSFLKARFKHTNTREIRCCRLSRCTCSSFLPHFEIFCQNTAYADRF